MAITGPDSARVERLVYRVLPGGGISYAKTEQGSISRMGLNYVGPPEDVVGSTAGFTVTISEGGEPGDCFATVEMVSDFSMIEAAREVVEPYLLTWEIQSLVDHFNDHGDFGQPLRFEYLSAEVSNPTPISAIAHLPTVHAFIKGQFPSPPNAISASPEVRLMWRRWGAYRAGRESLPAMAYYCLTTVEATVGGPSRITRQAAADRYSIDVDVLNKLGELTSEVGDEHERRKAHAKHQRPYTAAERDWIERVVLALIERVGRVAWCNANGINAPAPN